ncbi:hypothetical protein [Cryobacterium soli]|uniref:hypothetical protein n=1 Tax=Cryobacterium soli TaxID=2220095 RepID=UPI001FE8CEA4|nr:hypothetical protein [Cryobacterium soli]
MTDQISNVTPTSAEPDFSGPPSRSIQDWTDLGKEMWSYLTGKSAVIDYSFIDMTVEVPRDIGPDAPRATWKLNGTVRVTTSEAPGGAAAPSSSRTD